MEKSYPWLGSAWYNGLILSKYSVVLRQDQCVVSGRLVVNSSETYRFFLGTREFHEKMQEWARHIQQRKKLTANWWIGRGLTVWCQSKLLHIKPSQDQLDLLTDSLETLSVGNSQFISPRASRSHQLKRPAPKISTVWESTVQRLRKVSGIWPDTFGRGGRTTTIHRLSETRYEESNKAAIGDAGSSCAATRFKWQ